MTDDLKERLEGLAIWHSSNANDALLNGSRAFHARSAADIRAAIVSADDATKNMLCLRAFKAKDRRFTGEGPTGFGEL